MYSVFNENRTQDLAVAVTMFYQSPKNINNRGTDKIKGIVHPHL